MPVATRIREFYIERFPRGPDNYGVATAITAFIGRRARTDDEPITINSNSDFERTFGGLWTESTLVAVRDFYLNGGSQAIIVRLYHPKFATTQDRDKALAAATAVATATPADAAAAAAAVQRPALSPRPGKTAAEVVANARLGRAAQARPPRLSKPRRCRGGSRCPDQQASLDVNGLNLGGEVRGAWGNALRARIDHDVIGPMRRICLIFPSGTQHSQIEVCACFGRACHVRQVDKCF